MLSALSLLTSWGSYNRASSRAEYQQATLPYSYLVDFSPELLAPGFELVAEQISDMF